MENFKKNLEFENDSAIFVCRPIFRMEKNTASRNENPVHRIF